MKYKVVKTTTVGYAMNKKMADELKAEIENYYKDDYEISFHIEVWKS